MKVVPLSKCCFRWKVNLLGAAILDPIFFGMMQASVNQLAAASSPAFARR